MNDFIDLLQVMICIAVFAWFCMYEPKQR